MLKKTYSFNIGVVGEPGVGKTAYITRVIDNRFTADYQPTIGGDYRVATIALADESIVMRFWDLGYQHPRARSSFCFSRQHGFLLMIDVTNPNSFHHLFKWLQDIDRYAEDHKKVIVLGTKCEKINERVIDKNIIDKRVSELGFSYMEISAKDNINVLSSLLSLIQTPLMRHSDILQSAIAPSSKAAREAIIIAAKNNYKVIDSRRLLEKTSSFELINQRYGCSNLSFAHAYALQNNAARIWLLQGAQLVCQYRLPANLFIMIASYILGLSFHDTCEVRTLIHKKLLTDVIQYKKATFFSFCKTAKIEAKAIERHEKRLNFKLN